MACEITRLLLHGYLDGELDAARAAEFETHLESCSDCTAELESQESLRSAIHQSSLYEKVPSALRSNVTSHLKDRRSPRYVQGRVWQWAVVAACFLGLLYVATRSEERRANGEIAAQLIDDHIRSLQPGHLSDVVSTDQHTVKPWFDGKLDFSPPVQDFSAQGFPLLGGRLEVMNGRSIAALIYGRRKHVINVFVWPPTPASVAMKSGSQQGYNWIHWNSRGFEMWAVSDVNAADLEQLHQLLGSH